MSESVGGVLRRLDVRSRVAGLRGFVTIPGAISLWGVVLAGLTLWADTVYPEAASLFDLDHFDADTARSVFGTLAGAAMAALTLVYSVVLLVFTLAAGTIAPRLLERFSHDRVNQVAVGSLGALFLHAIICLAAVGWTPIFLSLGAAIVMSVVTVLLLLFFVDHVARRVTIDEEISVIAEELDAQFKTALERSADVDPESLVAPDGPEAELVARRSGYVNRIDIEGLVEAASEAGVYVYFNARQGDHLLKGDPVGRAVGPGAEAFVEEAEEAMKIGPRRTAEEDLMFSINLLLEIALRALSPGVNDSFTAIACIDRLAATLAGAAERGLASGVFSDATGAARVVAPTYDLDAFVQRSFAPIRRASAGNVIVAEALVAAIGRLRSRLPEPAAKAAGHEIELAVADAAKAGASDEDVAMLRAAASPSA